MQKSQILKFKNYLNFRCTEVKYFLLYICYDMGKQILYITIAIDETHKKLDFIFFIKMMSQH